MNAPQTSNEITIIKLPYIHGQAVKTPDRIGLFAGANISFDNPAEICIGYRIESFKNGRSTFNNYGASEIRKTEPVDREVLRQQSVTLAQNNKPAVK